ncbi:ATP-binding protein [Mycoplasmopsis glycophila]|uniref:DNA replication protein n=1 Tax=Mycoplasmopsis glycophila TaxID=171285 RepID=A0A449AW69_9BACT|nr:ATP-binding protein [Mycoplasmopsis glycophila]VEU70919.1 DNA replication protein [Mycoplasmopsis glycophila]
MSSKMVKDVLDDLYFDITPRSQKELIDSIKKEVLLSSIIKKLQITDDEIWDNYIELKDFIQENKENDENKIYKTIILRNNDNELVFAKQIVKNENSKRYLLENNLAFSNISKPMNDLILQEIDTIKEHSHFDLYNYKHDLLSKIEQGNNQITGCFIQGDYASLRSHALSAIANTLMVEDYEVAYINANYLEDQLKTNFSSANNETNFVINSLIDIDVLVIDEIGFKKYSAWFIETVLIKILESRLINNKLTFIGSYLSIRDLNKIVNPNNKTSVFALKKLESIIIKLCPSQIWIGR